MYTNCDSNYRLSLTIPINENGIQIKLNYTQLLQMKVNVFRKKNVISVQTNYIHFIKENKSINICMVIIQMENVHDLRIFVKMHWNGKLTNNDAMKICLFSCLSGFLHICAVCWKCTKTLVKIICNGIANSSQFYCATEIVINICVQSFKQWILCAFQIKLFFVALKLQFNLCLFHIRIFLFYSNTVIVCLILYRSNCLHIILK